MTYSFKCTNTKCKNDEKEILVSCKYEDLTKNINCKECKEEMSRIWSVPSIKTNDGFKG